MRLLLVIAAAFVGFAVLATDAPGQKKDKDKDKEPPEKKTTITEIGGRSIDQWIKEIPSKDRSKGENAIRTILMFHPDQAYEAVPVLLAELKKHPNQIVLDISIRVNAVIALGVILGGANDPDSKLVGDAVTMLIRFLGDDQAIVKYRAAQALGRLGPDAKPALEKLIIMTRDTSTWENRQAATAAIGLIARHPKKAPDDKVFATLMKRLADPASQVRLAAIQSLTWVGGPTGPKRQAELIKGLEVNTLRDPDYTIRIWTHMAIMAIERKIQKKHLKPIADMLNVKDKKDLPVDLPARVQAAQSLGTIGPDAANKETVKALCDALKDPEPGVIFWSMWALARFGKAAQAAVMPLQGIVKDPNLPEVVKVTAQQTMDIIQGKEKGKEKEKQKEKDKAAAK